MELLSFCIEMIQLVIKERILNGIEIPNDKTGGVRGGWGRDIRACHFSN